MEPALNFIESLADLEQLYDEPAEASLLKVATQITPEYREWIARSRFCILSTVGSDGTDATPRGDDGPVVRELDDQTLLMPDWRGNNRIDNLRNIVVDPRISLMFFVLGANNVIRVNGTAKLTKDAELLASFEHKSVQPRSVIVFNIAEIYSQCARAFIRAGVWSGKDHSEGLPTMGAILASMKKGDFDGDAYDGNWSERAKKTMW